MCRTGFDSLQHWQQLPTLQNNQKREDRLKNVSDNISNMYIRGEKMLQQEQGFFSISEMLFQKCS